MTSTLSVQHIWNGKNYHNHSIAQASASAELISYLKIKGHEKILDVGCGDGKISAALASKAYQGSVMGVDLSKSMISFAKKLFPKTHYSNLQFLIADANNLKLVDLYDVIFSSFALQWLEHPSSFFTKAATHLQENGVLALTIPLDISKALEEATAMICLRGSWHEYFKDFSPGWYFQSSKFYEDNLQALGLEILHLKVKQQTVLFKNLSHLKDYIKQWFSYINALDQDLREPFFEAIIGEYRNLVPTEKDGSIPFTFSRVDIIAKKTPSTFTSF